VTITSSITSSQASVVLVDVEVYDPSSNKVFQQWFDNQSFTPGQNRTFSSTWQVASAAAAGTYTIDIGIFSPGWSALRTWNGSAGSESIGASASPPSTPTLVPSNTPTRTPTATSTPTARPTNTPQPPTATATAAARSFTTGATVAPPTVSRGASDTITASVTSATATSALVDVEIYSSSGVKVFQQWWDNQALGAGQARTFPTSWTVPTTLAPGNYIVVVGIFSTGWGTLYNWNGNAAILTIV
jgi:hypothetical protein